MLNTVLAPGRTAVITGAASGIGFAAARHFSSLGMNVVMADLEGAALNAARLDVEGVAKGAGVVAVATDVSRRDDVERLRDAALSQFGDVAVLMNNAAARTGDGKPWQDPDRWRQVIDVNLMGVVNGVTVFTESMIAQAQAQPYHQHGIEAGHHQPARRGRLQHQQGRCAGADRAARLRAGRGCPACERASAHSRLDLHQADRRDGRRD